MGREAARMAKRRTTPHTAAFLAVRDKLLALDDADRLPLARLFGAMTAPEHDLSVETIGLLRAIAELDTDGVLRLQHWCRTYVNRWGQVPLAGVRTNAVRPKTEGTPEA